MGFNYNKIWSIPWKVVKKTGGFKTGKSFLWKMGSVSIHYDNKKNDHHTFCVVIFAFMLKPPCNYSFAEQFMKLD